MTLLQVIVTDALQGGIAGLSVVVPFLIVITSAAILAVRSR
jgi:hypothetical protein